MRVVTDLVRRYRDYYREQTPEAFSDLFRCMLDYDFSSYHEDMRRVFAMWREAKCVGESRSLLSGGSSTGIRRRYEFGPNFQQARLAVEGFLRMSQNKTLLVAVARGLGNPMFSHDANAPQYDFQIVGDWGRDDHLEALFSEMARLASDFGPVNLCALPCVWLALTCNPAFSRLSVENKSSVNAFVNTDSTPCFRSPACRTRDQMIDWGSGVNFYTCDHNERHFLPTFFSRDPASACNLLNLKRPSRSCDDFVGLGLASETCPCGRPKIRLEFVPHRENFPLDESGSFIDVGGLFDAAPDYTDWMQVLQGEEGKSLLFYSCSRGEADLGGMLTLMEGAGFGKTDVVLSKYFALGTKKPVFWRLGNPVFFDRG